MLNKLSLRNQLIAMILFTSMLAMAVAGITLFVTEIARSRDALNEELTSLARLIGDRSSAALIFLDNKTATENLNSFSNLEQIGSACLFNDRGELFAQFKHAVIKVDDCTIQKPISQNFVVIKGNTERVQVPVIANGELIGAVQINSTAAPLLNRMAAQTLSLAIAMTGALIVAILLAIRLQRLISNPLAQVRDVANAIVQSKDYTLRAPNLGEYEIGQLSSAFNSMLQTIENQNIVLAESESYSKKLFYESPIPQLISDPHTKRYLDCNQAAAIIHGYKDREELIGKFTSEVSPEVQPDGRPSGQVMDERYRNAELGEINVHEFQYRHRDGTLWEGLITYSLFTRNGQELAHLCVEDITYRKQAEERLQQMNEQLEARVASRTRDLASANSTLQKAHSELQRTQNELIQREKMASLGVLIAGVAHEMNTPLGNSLTAASYLHDEFESFNGAVTDGKVSKSKLMNFNEQMQSGLDLLIRNLKRAIELVIQFKQVSVDQASDQRRSFDLAAIVTDNISILQPQFKRTSHSIVMQVPPGIKMDSYPGAIGQIITNLVLNSLIHGFSEDMSGVIQVKAELVGDQSVNFTVSDNGKGIPVKNLKHVFDPFFTTRMGVGGSGLGLNIVYNMVTSTLGGTIVVKSEEGMRTTFSINMPLVAPPPTKT